MNQVGVNDHQISFRGNKYAIVEKEDPPALENIEDFILRVKMLDLHVMGAEADHVLNGQSVNGAVEGYLLVGGIC